MAPSSGDAGGDHHLAGSRCPQSLGVKENKASNLAASRMGETLPPHPACALGQIGAIWDHAVENWGGVQLRAAFPLHGVIRQAEADHGSVPTGLGVSAGPHPEDGGEAEQPPRALGTQTARSRRSQLGGNLFSCSKPIRYNFLHGFPDAGDPG